LKPADEKVMALACEQFWYWWLQLPYLFDC